MYLAYNSGSPGYPTALLASTRDNFCHPSVQSALRSIYYSFPYQFLKLGLFSLGSSSEYFESVWLTLQNAEHDLDQYSGHIPASDAHLWWKFYYL